MNSLLAIFFFAAAFVLGAGAVLFFVYIKRNTRDPILDLHARVEERMQFMQKTMLDQLNEVTRQINDRLRENVDFAQKAHQATAHAVGQVGERLVALQEQSKWILDVGKDVTELQDILRAPKLRGVLGEFFLGDLLSQILPKEHYFLQHRFKSGEQVDALVKIREDLGIPIDAKFPLENFRRFLTVHDEDAQTAALRDLTHDVKKHIDAIAKKYIVPAEGTTDFAMMYIPAENVYYEVFVADRAKLNLAEYAFSKRIIPISPNSIYAYLQAVMSGLRGLQVEKGAREILNYITDLEKYFTQFSERFHILGAHLRDADKSYDMAERQLDRFGEHMTQLEHRRALPEQQRTEEKSSGE